MAVENGREVARRWPIRQVVDENPGVRSPLMTSDTRLYAVKGEMKVQRSGLGTAQANSIPAAIA